MVVIHPDDLLKYLQCRQSKEELDEAGECLGRAAFLSSKKPYGEALALVHFKGSQSSSQFLRLNPDSDSEPLSLRLTHLKLRLEHEL